MATHAQREHLARLMDVLVNHEPQIDYPLHDVRGPKDRETFQLTEAQALARLRGGGRLMADCSGMVTCLCKWAGLDDPNGLRYDHEGYTGTMLAHLPHYRKPGNAMVGALVVFGPSTGEHVCMVRKPGADPLLFSHGFEGGPLYVKLSAERTAHRPPVTFLSIAAL